MTSSARAPWLIAIGGLVSLAAAMGIGRFVYTPILPFMVEAVPLGRADAGLVAAANFLGYLAGALAASLGRLPGSRRLWFLSALAVSAATTAAMAGSSALAAFLILRFIGGVASAFVLVFSSALVLDRLAAAGKPGYSAVHFAGVGAGIALSAVAIGFFADLGLTWAGLWLVSGALTLLFLALAAFLVPPEPDAQHGLAAGSAPQEASISLRGSLLRLVIAYGLFGFGYIITATFISLIAREDPALNPAEPYVWLVVGLAAVPSVYFWNQVALRSSGPAAFAIACLVEAVGVGLSVITESPAGLLLAAALLGGTLMGITALGLIQARQLAPAATRQSLAIMTASFGLGQMLGPLLAGFLSEATGNFVIASFAAVAALIVAAGLVMVGRGAR